MGQPGLLLKVQQTFQQLLMHMLLACTAMQFSNYSREHG
jgi:hypothetical protein